MTSQPTIHVFLSSLRGDSSFCEFFNASKEPLDKLFGS